MQNLVLAGTEYTPLINFDSNQNILTITGNSYPEDTTTFYAPIFSWLHAYFQQVSQETDVIFNIELAYFNSSSSKVLFDLFDLINQKAFNQAIPIDVYWRYDPEDEDTLEYGRDFETEFRAIVFHFAENSAH
jgi:hypothetical protein